MRRLAGEILLHELALERDAMASVGSMLGNEHRSFECPEHRANAFNLTARSPDFPPHKGAMFNAD